MVLFVSSVLGMLVAVIFTLRGSRARLRKLQEAGLYPLPGQESDADVDRLLAAGEKILAIRVYRSLHRCGLREAKAAVDALAATSR